MAIEGFIGGPGSGKTYTLTERALRERDRGRDVFANYDVEGCYRFTPDQLLDLPPGLVILDEAHLWFPSRAAMKLPMSWLQMVSQTRKNGWDIYFSTQHERRMDRALLDVSNLLWLCSAWIPGPGHPWFFRAISYEPEFFRRPKNRLTTSWRVFNQRVASSYDTYERLAVADHVASDDDVYGSKSKSGVLRRAV